MPQNILILGDGNFSFTLACLKTNAFGDSQIISTSFDSYEQLAKYTDSHQIIKKIQSYKNCKVIHEINAWELNFDIKFDLILWNHPHLGTEDFRLHSFLLVHFFDSAVRHLTENGVVRLSLVQGQETRWDVVAQAKKLDLKCVNVQLFEEFRYPGYVVKRNKHGGSFKNIHTKKHVRTAMKSCVFDFCKNGDSVDVNELLVSFYGMGFSDTYDRKHVTENELKIEVGNTTNGKEVPADLKCTECAKQLSSSRAFQQHFHMVHRLKLFGADWKPDRPKNIHCTNCNKSFADQDSLWQHEVNKHSEIKPKELPVDMDERLKKNSNEQDYGYVPCPVCGQSCSKQEWGMELHLESLKPAMGLDMRCPLCKTKTFIEQRALFQHFKFCRLTR